MNWFQPAGVTWTPVSSRLATARLVVWWLVMIPLVIAGIYLAPIAAGAIVGVAVFGTWVIVRQVSAHGWAERDDDLMVRRGRLFRRVTVVPYGRMQFVDVQAGPLARVLGIARVQLHTASSGSDAHISGVPTDEAARLRDRLTTRGEAKLAGL